MLAWVPPGWRWKTLLLMLAGCGVRLPVPVRAAVPAEFDAEQLHYYVNWPSGLSLGEAEFQASRVKGAAAGSAHWEFRFQLDAAVPGFQVKDLYRSRATADFCSEEFTKQVLHGARKADETTVVDPASGSARRTTRGGGSSTIQAAPCVKDSLAFLYFLRAELMKGRLPSPQVILSGAAYRVRLEYRGTRSLTIAGEPTEADRIGISLKGPASETRFDVYFARDAVHTPVLVVLPLPSGVIQMELAR
ncbi:MAG: DUF3108 domain-containing protein [Bryobacterales bacterium]|nr:DUF3108 domain-containing protein [Bryobacterales bacterium]